MTCCNDGKMTYDTEAHWKEVNPILDRGEPGFEIDTFKLKIGDGAKDWMSLPYVAGGSGGSVSSGQVMVVQDVEVSGGSSGSYPQNTWIKRKLNTEAYNTIPGASLDGTESKVTLPVGVYLVHGNAPAWSTGQHMARLAKENGEDLMSGSMEVSNTSDGTQTISILTGVLDLAEETVVELQHRFAGQSSTAKFRPYALGTSPSEFDKSLIAQLMFQKIG